MLKKLADFLLRKAGWNGFGPDRWYAGEHSWFGNNAAGVAVNPETSLTCSTAAACVRLLATSVASLPCYIYRDAGRSKLKAPEHPLWPVLLKQPNEYQTAYNFWQHVMVHAILHGNLYCFIQRNDAGTPIALWPLRHGTVTVEIENGEVSYHYVFGSTKTVFPNSEICHFKNLSLNGIVGMSTLQMAREGIGEALAQVRHSASLFRNAARPGLIMKFPSFLTQEQRERYKGFFAGDFSGALNSGKTVLLEGGMDVAPIGFSSEDSQFLQSREFSVREVARWFGVPAHMVGDPTRTSYASSENEMLTFLTHSLRPWLVNLESEINLKLFPARTQFFARFDTTALARGDQATRYGAYSQGLAAGFLTVADVREAENLPYIPGTEKLLRPANMMPSGDVLEGSDSDATDNADGADNQSAQ